MQEFLLITLALQVVFAIHVVRTGRAAKWLYYILLLPLIGCCLYLVREVWAAAPHCTPAVELPDALREQLRRVVSRLKAPYNVDSVVQLAGACIDNRLYDGAIELINRVRGGVFRHDGELLLCLARAHYGKEDFAASKEVWETLRAHNPHYRSPHGHLLYARTLEALGQDPAAAREYADLSAYFPGPEAKYRYGLLLQRLGQVSAARDLFAEIAGAAQPYSRSDQAEHHQWVQLARRQL